MQKQDVCHTVPGALMLKKVQVVHYSSLTADNGKG